ncbi:MAG: hypothetical protein AB7K52_02000 [Phycisphaerales bacterium]
MHPRKVRGGVRLESREGLPLAWAGQRWMRLVEDHAANAALTEGMQYARLGQTRSLQIMSGHIAARVQGRLPAAYAVDVRLPVFTHDQWEAATTAMLEEARHLAGLLSGEVPAGIEDLFAPLHLRLFPQDPSDLAISCTCARHAARPMYAMPEAPMPPGPGADGAASGPAPASPFCKHACCVLALLAERLSRDPFLIFQLRGLAKDDLLERLRQKRALAAARLKATGSSGVAGLDRPVPAYSPRIPGLAEEPAPALELCVSEFWHTRPELADLDLPLERPEVSHVLLRRLGPTPFAEGKFPLVGLLATCYEVISERALAEAEAPAVDGDSLSSDEPA